MLSLLTFVACVPYLPRLNFWFYGTGAVVILRSQGNYIK